MNEPAKGTYYFTFGFGWSLKNCYVKIEDATMKEARDAMFAAYNRDWSFQYTEKEFKGQVEEFNLKEVPIGTPNKRL